MAQPTRTWLTISKYTHLPSFPQNNDIDLGNDISIASSSSPPSYSWRLENASSSPPCSHQHCLSSSSANLIQASDLLCECDASVLGRVGYKSCVGQTLAVLLRWTEVLLRKIANAYLGNWILLMLVPCLFGLGIGCWLGRNIERKKKNGGENDKKRGYHTSGRCREERESQLKSYYGCDGVKESLHRVSSLFSSTTALIFTIVFEISNSLFSKTFSCSFLKGELPQQEEERELEKKEDKARSNLRSSAQTQYESGVNTQDIPKHIAVIMDGNRRYGRKVYGSATKVCMNLRDGLKVTLIAIFTVKLCHNLLRIIICIASPFFLELNTLTQITLILCIGPLGWFQDFGKFCQMVSCGTNTNSDCLRFFHRKLEPFSCRNILSHDNISSILRRTTNRSY
uniref:Alkyl transferase n=1 Tax=Ditylum brightwellii TaxID=49249 RepID=A0A7S4R975_9STRA